MCIYNETIPYIYKWTHIPSGKWYIGSKTLNGWNPSRHEEYICSSKEVKPLVLANRKDWVYEILHTGAADYIVELETKILTELDARNNPMSFNQHNGDGLYNRIGTTHSQKTLDKMSKSHKGQTPWNKGKKHTAAHIEKVVSQLRGRKNGPRSEEAKAAQSEKMKGNIPWNAGKTGLQVAWNKGIALPKEVIAKQQEAKRLNGTGSYQKLSCPYCNSIVDKPNYSRWHGDKCKNKIAN
jgi:hypothetical protein